MKNSLKVFEIQFTHRNKQFILSKRADSQFNEQSSIVSETESIQHNVYPKAKH